VPEEQPHQPLTYANIGIDFEKRQSIVEGYRDVVGSANNPRVLGSIGAFAGMFALGSKYKDPVIVASTDGVGTKVKLAALTGSFESIGHDIVNACLNDLLTTGAEPLFFLDYIGSVDLPREAKVSLVKGINDACTAAGMVLLGGETADMPGVYPPGEFDLVGFVVGVVERDKIIDASRIQPGDLLFGIPSDGLHTNGFSLARVALDIAVNPDKAEADKQRLMRHVEELGMTLGEALLKPHLSYLPQVQAAMSAGDGSLVKGLSHITGGGFEENIPRVLPPGLGARLQRNAWAVPPVFRLIQHAGDIDEEEMYRVFNMGIGLVIVVSAGDGARLRAVLPEAVEVGVVVPAPGEERVGWE
jgi:phosphoribosylformylglycinamidine cyclo-ligase